MGDRMPPFLSHVMGDGCHLRRLLGNQGGIELPCERVVPGTLQHGGELRPELGSGPANRVSTDGGIEHDAHISLRRCVMVVGTILEAVKPQEFGLCLPHLADHLDTDALVGVIAAATPSVLAVGSAAVTLTILESKAILHTVLTKTF
jgi:hypothetical protein